jgi:transcription antitermination factor NusG
MTMDVPERYPGGFTAGDEVRVIGGSFAGMPGRVVTPEEARAVLEASGGEPSRYSRPRGMVWVVLSIFGRSAPARFLPNQLQTSPPAPAPGAGGGGGGASG